jgi:hypothetical protein
MPLLMLVRLNHDNFPGLQDRIANADTNLMNADMNQVEQLVRKYEQMQKALGISPDPASASARRAKQPDDKKTPAKNKTPTPSPTYPPDNFNWTAMIEWFKANKNACPGCYQRNNSLHRKIGCLALARCGFVCKFDPVGSKKVQEEHIKAQKAKGGEKQSAKQTSDEKTDGEEEKSKEDASQASAKRSTAQRSQLREGYYDSFLDLASDEESNDLDDRLKNNDNSAPYLRNTDNSAAKFKVVASARHVSTSLAAAAHLALQTSGSKISTLNPSHQECCADSGTTEHMLNEYKAFVSYRQCHDEYVTLGDDTQLKIYGRGTARFLLNDKLIEVRDANLHLTLAPSRHHHLHQSLMMLRSSFPTQNSWIPPRSLSQSACWLKSMTTFHLCRRCLLNTHRDPLRIPPHLTHFDSIVSLGVADLRINITSPLPVKMQNSLSVVRCHRPLVTL